jgi:hypothetical protein
VTLALLLVASRRLGISTGFEDVCSLVMRVPYFRRPTIASGRAWRLSLLAGLLVGGFVSALRRWSLRRAVRAAATSVQPPW